MSVDIASFAPFLSLYEIVMFCKMLRMIYLPSMRYRMQRKKWPMNVISRGHHENHMMEIKLGVPPSDDIHTGLSNRFERM